jgi:hypothetical protein
MTLLTVGEVENHHRGDRQCPECSENYPEGCRCGGLMHASDTSHQDADGNLVVVTAVRSVRAQRRRPRCGLTCGARRSASVDDVMC